MSNSSLKLASHSVEFAGGKLQYHEVGEGPCLLFLHGSGPGVTGLANFEGNLPAFADSFRCLVIDFPGYGASDPVEGDPIAGCVASAVGLLDALGVERAHVIGNSLGGIVGSQIAAQHGERVDRFVTIGGIGLNVFSPFPGEGLNLLTAFAEEPTRERMREWLHSMVYDPALVTEELIDRRFQQAMDPVTLATTRAMYSREAMAALTGFRSEMPTATLAHLASIERPTLIAWGRDDRVTPMDIALIPMRIIPDCEVHVFSRCGHWVMIERKEAFESLVRAFFGRS